MTLEEAFAWAEKNCDDATCQRLRSRMVVRVLVNEIESLRNTNERWKSFIEHAHNSPALYKDWQ